MEKRLLTLAFLCVVSNYTFTDSPHMIVCTLKKYPTLPTSQSENKKFLSSAAVKQTQGIYSSYFGYLNASNEAGQIIFPRRHNDSTFTLAITEKIEPIFMLENTINTWRIPKTTSSYAYYTVERKKDVQTGLYFWDVRKEALPDDRALPLNVIMIIAKPEDLYVPTGISVTTNSPQLTLPTIYVKNDMRTSDAALSLFPLRQFFESISQTSKVQGSDLQSKVTKK